MKIKVFNLFLLSILFLSITSCSGAKEDTLNEKLIQDNFTILKRIEIENGYVIFFERSTYKDIGVALMSNSNNNEETSVGGYLSQNIEDANWHYSSSELEGETYSIYYGRLDEQRDGEVFIKLGTQISKKPEIIEASSSTIWYLIFDERIEISEVEASGTE